MLGRYGVYAPRYRRGLAFSPVSGMIQGRIRVIRMDDQGSLRIDRLSSRNSGPGRVVGQGLRLHPHPDPADSR